MINPKKIIQEWEKDINQKTKDLVKTFFSSDWNGQRFILGKNDHAAFLLDLVEINGIIDDFAEADTKWNNIGVIKADDVPNNAIIINCSMSISPISAFNRLSELNVLGVISYSDLYKISPERVSLPNFVVKSRDDIYDNINKWTTLQTSLYDNDSKKVLNDLICYRLTGDFKFMHNYSVRIKDQYFEPFLNMQKDEVFVDCGGFDGDTTEEFCIRYPEYKKVHLFEPSEKNLKKT